MNKATILGISLLALIIFIQTGCSNRNNNEEKNAKKSLENNIHIGIIETTGQKNESYITFLDNELNFIKEEKFNFGSMGSPFDLPKVIGDSVYVIPKGLVSKDLSIVLEYNILLNSITEYDIGQQNMNSLAVNDKYIFIANTINKESIISRCEKSSKDIATIKIPSIYICKIDYYDGILYAFGEEMNESEVNKSFLYLIDCSDFKIKDTIDISECGAAQASTLKIGNDIYFTNQYDIYGNPVNILSKFDSVSKKIVNYSLDNNFPYQIIEYNDKLIVTHYDLVQNKGNSITLLEKSDGSFETKTFKDDTGQMYLLGNQLYSADIDNLRIYNLDDFSIDKEVSLHFQDSEDVYYYFSSFFLNQ